MVRATASGWDGVNFLHSRCYAFSLWQKQCWYHIPLVSLGQLSWPMLPPSTSSLAKHRKLKSPWLKISIAWQQPKHHYVANVIFILNPKHTYLNRSLPLHILHTYILVRKLTLSQPQPNQINTTQPLTHPLPPENEEEKQKKKVKLIGLR